MMRMTLKLSLIFSFFLLFQNVWALNITEILSKYPNFSTFNSYLTQTSLAGQINSRQSITILAVDNSNIASLSGKSADALKNILSLHVVLDYYDEPKLQKMSNKSITLTTLLQTTGAAKGQQGFLNATRLDAERVAFGSAAAGSTLGSNLVKSVTTQPYNLSVLQVSSVIIPQGVDGGSGSPSSSPSSAPATTPGAGPTSSAKSPMSNTAPSTAPATAPSTAPATAPSMTPNTAPSKAPISSPSMAPISQSPKSSPAPDSATAPAPHSADSPAPKADAPKAEEPTSDAPAGAHGPTAAESTRLEIDIAVAYTMVLSTIYLASRI